jgi:type VI secretion system secreted protein VgrG
MKRAVNAQTPLGDDLMFSALSGREEMSRLLDFALEFRSTKPSIPVKALLGQSITVDMRLQNGAKRYLNAQCSHFHATGKSGRFYVYEARLRPWLWYATRRSDYKIFQGLTVPEIILDVLGKYPFQIKNKLNASYRKWDYNVQYRETDFNYVSRLMEHEGIYYYFEHESGEHSLVLCDGIIAHSPFPGYESVPYYPPDSVVPDEDYFDTWVVGQAIDPGQYSTDDYDFTKPSSDLTTGREKPRPHPHSSYEIYDFPGGFTDDGDGNHYSRVRMEELQADHELIQGFGEVRGAAPGHLITLKRHPRADQNREYLIASAHYVIRDNSYEGNSVESNLSWRVSIEALPSSEMFRPARLTPKPHSMGPETAVVVGPEGEEIWTDEYGRVKVQFHWDRYGKKDEKSSCWIRLALPWAGSNWGFIHIPRIGQEVLVDFIGGDPDYPIITGSVYNAEQMPPYGLPQNKTASGIKSRSSKGADSTDYNEFRFEDMKGQEQVYLHAQRNLDSVVELDESHIVGHDRQTRIEHDDQRFVKNSDTHIVVVDQTITVGGNQVESILGNRMLAVGGDQEAAVSANATLNVGQAMKTNVGTHNELTIGEDYACSVGGNTRYMFQGALNSLILDNRQAVIKGNDERTVLGNSSYMAADYALTTVTNHSLTVGANRSAMVMGADDTKIIGAQTNMIGGSQTNAIGTSQSNTVGGPQTNQIGATQSTTVAGAMTTTAGAAMSFTSGATLSLSSAGVISTQAGGVTTITSGGAVTITAPVIMLNAASVVVSGILTATTVTTTSVISPLYTPGVGNMV